MRLSKLKERRERTLSVHLPHVIKDEKSIENLFTGNFSVKLHQSSKLCHVVFSSIDEKISNYKAVKDKTINGKRIIVKPLPALIHREKTKKIHKEKTVIPEIKPDIKITQTIFISNLALGIKSHEVQGALPGCIHVTLLKSCNKGFRCAIAKMKDIHIAEEYLKQKSKWPVLKGYKMYLKSDTRKKHKRSLFSKKFKIYDDNKIEDKMKDTIKVKMHYDTNSINIKGYKRNKAINQQCESWRFNIYH